MDGGSMEQTQKERDYDAALTVLSGKLKDAAYLSAEGADYARPFITYFIIINKANVNTQRKHGQFMSRILYDPKRELNVTASSYGRLMAEMTVATWGDQLWELWDDPVARETILDGAFTHFSTYLDYQEKK